MRIGVISAFGKESRPLRSKLEEVGRERVDGHILFFLRLGEDEITVVRTGSGKRPGAEGTQLLIDRVHPQAIINCGVAGAISPHRRIGDVVISERVIEYDSPCGEGPQGRVYRADVTLFESDRWDWEQTLPGGGIVVGTVLSGDPVIETARRREELWKRYHGECVEQEGAGIARVCESEHLPWIAIRGISDRADENLKEDFRENLDRAAHRAALVTLELIKRMAGRSIP